MKYIIFDFDGTVADTLPHILAIGQQILGVHIAEDQVEQLRNTPTKKIIKQYKIPIYKIPSLLVQGRRMFTKHIQDIKPVPGLIPVIKQLHKDGYRLQIISSNSVPNIKKFLDHHNLHQYFEQVHGSVGLFSKPKAIRRVIKSLGIKKSECVYVGDEVRDIEAAHKVGIKIISVTTGLNGEKILRKTKPDFLARKPEEILSAVAQMTEA